MQRLQRPALVALTHRVLADLTRTSDPGAAAGHLERCLELEKPLGYPRIACTCLWTSSLLDAGARSAARGLNGRDAIDALAANPGGPLLVYAWQARLRLVWQTLTEAEAMAASLQALDAVERLRARQQDDTGRAALFSHWTRDYYWLAGRLLDARRRTWRRRSRSVSGCARGSCSSTSTRAGLPDRNAVPAISKTPASGSDKRHRPDPAAAAGSRGPGHERPVLLDQLRLLEIEEGETRTAVHRRSPRQPPSRLSKPFSRHWTRAKRCCGTRWRRGRTCTAISAAGRGWSR